MKNDFVSYLFLVNKERVLQHLYFGKSVADFDAFSFTNLGFDWSKTYLSKTGEEKQYEDGYYHDRSLLEVPSFGYGDERGALIIARQAQGSSKTLFLYSSHRIYDGLPKSKTLPSFKNAGSAKTLEIVLEDEAKGLKLVLSFSLIDGFAGIIRGQKLIATKETDVLRAYSLAFDLPSSDYKLTHFSGDWSYERRLIEEKIEPGTKVLGNTTGRSSHEENPFFFLSEPGSEEENGEVYGFSFLYSGSWKGEINVAKFNSTRILLGINDSSFSYRLMPKEEMELPFALLCHSSSGFGPLSRNLHDFERNHIISFPSSYLAHPILINSWEACFMDFDTAKLLTFAKEARMMGTDLFVLDDGWFGERNDDTSSLGDWYVNTKKVDMEKLISYVHESGMKFGLWFEPEMVNPKSVLFKEHPEFALANLEEEPDLSRHQLQLDLANPKVINYLYDAIENILSKFDIDYVKWDHNRSRGTAYSPYLKNEKEGELEYRNTMGYYELLSRLTSKHQNILFEGCASGGGRYDLGELFYTPQIWCSDETDPVQRLFIQYSTSYAYPLVSMGTHISKNPIMDYASKGEIALFGTYGLELDPTKLSEKEKEEIRKTMDAYRRLSPLIAEGDLYRLRNPYHDNSFCLLVINKAKSQGVFLYVNLLKENARYRYVKLRGLKKDTQYTLSGYERSLSGEYLMNVGINLYGWQNEFQSHYIELQEVAK